MELKGESTGTVMAVSRGVLLLRTPMAVCKCERCEHAQAQLHEHFRKGDNAAANYGRYPLFTAEDDNDGSED